MSELKKVYRVICYEMTEERLEHQLNKSLADGVHRLYPSDESITVVTLDDADVSLPIRTLIGAQTTISRGCTTKEQLKTQNRFTFED